MREAAGALGAAVCLGGSNLEGEAFWSGIWTHRPAGSQPLLEGICAVVQPALVEDRPRLLLAARSAGIPVIASPAC